MSGRMVVEIYGWFLLTSRRFLKNFLDFKNLAGNTELYSLKVSNWGQIKGLAVKLSPRTTVGNRVEKVVTPVVQWRWREVVSIRHFCYKGNMYERIECWIIRKKVNLGLSVMLYIKSTLHTWSPLSLFNGPNFLEKKTRIQPQEIWLEICSGYVM